VVSVCSTAWSCFFSLRKLDPAAVLGALLAFRGIFYLIPLLSRGHDVRSLRDGSLRRSAPGASRRITRAIPRVVPTVLALLVFLTGMLIVIAGALPVDPTDRLDWIAIFLPVGLFELSHTISAFVGRLLLFLAIALNRRMEAAFTGSQIVLGLAFVLSILRGGWEEAVAVAFVMIGSRRAAVSSIGGVRSSRSRSQRVSSPA
jgi:phosphatidylglycerol lysyltransferase